MYARHEHSMTDIARRAPATTVVSRFYRISNQASLAWNRARRRLRSVSSIAYIGGEGGENLGDEAMLAIVAERCARVGLDVDSVAYPRQERRLEGLGLSASHAFAGAFLSGGTLINDHWFAKTALVARWGLPLYSIGTGVGAPGLGMQEQSSNYAQWRDVLSEFLFVGVRGPLSQERLAHYGIESVVTGDLALALARKREPDRAQEQKYVFNLLLDRSRQGTEEADRVHRAAVQCVRGLGRKGWSPIPVAMHSSDVPAIASVLGETQFASSTIHEPKTTDQFFYVCRRASFTIATRLHATVLGTCLGLPAIQVSYRDKCQDFMESMNLTDWNVPIEECTPERLLALAHELARSHDQISPAVESRALKWKHAIERQFTAFLRSVSSS